MRGSTVKKIFGVPCVGSGGRSVRILFHSRRIGTGDGIGQQALRRGVSTPTRSSVFLCRGQVCNRVGMGGAICTDSEPKMLRLRVYLYKLIHIDR